MVSKVLWVTHVAPVGEGEGIVVMLRPGHYGSTAIPSCVRGNDELNFVSFVSL